MARILITGVAGCLGAWTARVLLGGGHEPVGLDVADDDRRLRLLGIAGAFPVHHADVRDRAALGRVVDEARPDAVVHLAALQIPLCRADPARCAEVNVGGMMHLLELAREHGYPLVYASSAAVYGPDPGRRLTETEGLAPRTLYGVFKRANEEMAAVYGRDYGVRSVGFRPYVVYGAGRDLGVTADITLALEHAARGERFHIRFGGRVLLQHAEDVARAFVAAALRPRDGAAVYNLGGTLAGVTDVVQAIERVTGRPGLVTHDAAPLPIAADLSDDAFQRDLGPFSYRNMEGGFRDTLEAWAAAGTV
jgi:nucleoside-diphosphate-sugar epimerase